jgi:PadR family transcriptional regulator, regulatory protein PadR
MRVADDGARRSQLLRGVLDVCLLAVIADEPAYGYEMTRRLAERGLKVAEGSIYPVLGRLESDGFVDSFREASNGGPPRKYYRLTATGKEVLERWSEEWRTARAAVDDVLREKEVRS